MRRALLAAALGLAVAACGQDAPGAYLVAADRKVTLIQLTKASDGAVTGRLEEVSIGPGGIVSDQSTPLDAAAARRDLKQLKARRASAREVQAALTHLQSRASAERRRAADAQAIQAEHAVQSASIDGAGDKAARLQAATVELKAEADKLNAGVEASPDFARQAAQNTEQLAHLPLGAQAAASASQILNATNKVAVARSQYALSLNPLVQQGAPLAAEVQSFCTSAQGAAFSRPCGPATAAATDFQSAVVRAVTVFNGYKHAIQDDLARQAKLVQVLGG